MNLALVPRHLQASLSYHPAEATREGLKHYWCHTADTSVWKASVLNSSLTREAPQVALCSSPAVKADPAVPQGGDWLWHGVLGDPPLANVEFRLGREKWHLVDRGMPKGRCMAVHGGCQMVTFYLDELWTACTEYRNKRQAALCLCVCVFVCEHFDWCFAWLLLHYSESLSAVDVSEIQKR